MGNGAPASAGGQVATTPSLIPNCGSLRLKLSVEANQSGIPHPCRNTQPDPFRRRTRIGRRRRSTTRGVAVRVTQNSDHYQPSAKFSNQSTNRSAMQTQKPKNISKGGMIHGRGGSGHGTHGCSVAPPTTRAAKKKKPPTLPAVGKEVQMQREMW